MKYNWSFVFRICFLPMSSLTFLQLGHFKHLENEVEDVSRLGLPTPLSAPSGHTNIAINYKLLEFSWAMPVYDNIPQDVAIPQNTTFHWLNNCYSPNAKSFLPTQLKQLSYNAINSLRSNKPCMSRNERLKPVTRWFQSCEIWESILI